MSQYIPPDGESSLNSMIRETHQTVWTLHERLYGNGQPGDIDKLRGAVHELQRKQANQTGIGVAMWNRLLPVIAVLVAALAAFAEFRK